MHNFNLAFFSYFFVFSSSFLFVMVNPSAGVDYYSYVDIILKIEKNEYFKEPGFYVLVKLLLLFLSPSEIIFTFRVMVFAIFLKSIFLLSDKHKYFGLAFLICIPNLYIATLSSLSTAMALSIFLYGLILYGRAKNKRLLLFYAIASASFHFFAIVYVAIALLIYLGKRKMLIATIFTILIFFTAAPFLENILGQFGYEKYLSSGMSTSYNRNYSSFSSLVGIVGFFSILLTLFFFEKRHEARELFLASACVLAIFGFVVNGFEIGTVAVLRGLNYFLFITFIGIIAMLNKFNPLSRRWLSLFFSIFLISYFYNALLHMDSRVLNIGNLSVF